MAKLADATFSAGGTEYSFTAYSADTSFKDVSAVYIFTKRSVKDGKGSHSFLYIGETGELGTRIANHEKWECVNNHGCNCICVHRVEETRARLDIETSFLNANETPCNDR